MPMPVTRPTDRESTPEKLQRLYALWMISSLLLVLLVIVLTLLTTGRLRRQAQAISEQAGAIEQLRDDLSRTRQDLAQLRGAAFAPTPAAREPRAASVEPAPAEPAADVEASQAVAAPATVAANQRITSLLEAALQKSDRLGYALADPEAADQALREGLQTSDDRLWRGETWTRLAVVARLLDRDGPADMFALKATEANVFPWDYYEVSARRMLTQGRPGEALIFTNRLRAERPTEPRAGLLLGEAYCARYDFAAADLAIAALAGGDQLDPHGRLRLGRLLVELERWDRLEVLLKGLKQTERLDSAQLNFLHAVLAIQQNRLPEALAILDNLLAEQPGDYDFRTWRGVALLAARQFQAAREALAVAGAHPDRPQAWYWRGMLELRAGSPDDAIPFFQNGLAASQRYAPAWEALGTIALNRGDLPSAMQNLEQAIEANPRRAAAHFLIAIIQAKTLRPTATADASNGATGRTQPSGRPTILIRPAASIWKPTATLSDPRKYPAGC